MSAADLARFSEGDLSRRKSARISAHLAGCAHCRQVSSQLADVSALLASAQVPPIPAHLAARIETALATESAQRAASELAGAGQRGEAGKGWLAHDRPARDRPARDRLGRPRLTSRLAPRLLAAAGAVAVIAAGISYGLVRQTGSPAGSANSPAAAPVAGGRLGTAPVRGPALPYQQAGQPATFTPIATRTDFEPATIGAQVRASLLAAGSSEATGSARAGVNSPQAAPASPAMTDKFGRAVNVAKLGACVDRIVPDGEHVLLVDVAQYRGRPATIIVTAGASGPAEIWVAGPGCSASASDLLARDTLPQR